VEEFKKVKWCREDYRKMLFIVAVPAI